MENQPKRLLEKLLEAAIIFVIATYLIKLGVCYILCVLAGARHTCYSCNWRRDSLPDLEEEARLQLVKQEGIHV